MGEHLSPGWWGVDDGSVHGVPTVGPHLPCARGEGTKTPLPTTPTAEEGGAVWLSLGVSLPTPVTELAPGARVTHPLLLKLTSGVSKGWQCV